MESEILHINQNFQSFKLLCNACGMGKIEQLLSWLILINHTTGTASKNLCLRFILILQINPHLTFNQIRNFSNEKYTHNIKYL